MDTWRRAKKAGTAREDHGSVTQAPSTASAEPTGPSAGATMAFSGQSAWNSPGAAGSLAKRHNLEPCGADPEGRAGQHHSAEEDLGGRVGEHRAHHPKSPQIHV